MDIMTCEFCKSKLGEERLKHLGKGRLKYCSELCNKRASYIRKNNPANSLFTGNPQTGVAWEEWFINEFGAERPSRALNTPIDFYWHGEAIDLKVCELYKRKRKRGKEVDPAKQSGVWVFNRNTVKDIIDSYICIGLRDGVVDKVYKIPRDEFPRSGITVGANTSKYDQFLIELA